MILGGSAGSKCSSSHFLNMTEFMCLNLLKLIQGYVGRENNTFKTNDVKDLIIKGFKTITPEKWTNFCNHIENKIEPQYWKSDHSVIFPSNITLDIPPYHFDRVKFTMVWGRRRHKTL
jgi:hypothetical protein